jgi:hypothetical protein
MSVSAMVQKKCRQWRTKTGFLSRRETKVEVVCRRVVRRASLAVVKRMPSFVSGAKQNGQLVYSTVNNFTQEDLLKAYSPLIDNTVEVASPRVPERPRASLAVVKNAFLGEKAPRDDVVRL